MQRVRYVSHRSFILKVIV